jgi:hypothetical protein
MLITPSLDLLQPLKYVRESKVTAIDGLKEVGLKVLFANANRNSFAPQEFADKDIALG